MGVFIHLAISTSVTPEEWKSVYEETHGLVRKLPFADRREKVINGIPTVCLARTDEREQAYGWNGEQMETGWFTEGDTPWRRRPAACISTLLIKKNHRAFAR